MSGEWVEWHQGYERNTNQAGRLAVVQARVREALDRAPPGLIQLVSLCAGDARDVQGVLKDHSRRRDVRARLVELDSDLAASARKGFSLPGLEGVQVVQGDASVARTLEGAVPSDIVLLSGVFGNISDEDVKNTIHHLPELCSAGATVVWTRGRWAPDLTPDIRRWFRDAEFEELSFDSIPGTTASVGTNRFAGPPRRFHPGTKLFTFLPKDQRPSTLGRAADATAAAAVKPGP